MIYLRIQNSYKMKNTVLFSLICATLFCSSCARHIIVNFQDSSDSTGTIVLAPTAYIQNSVLTVDDKLLVDKKYIKKITVKNVPIGEHNVHFSADSWAYRDKIDENVKVTTKANKETAKIVPRPPFSTGYYIVWAAGILANVFIWLY
jgi:hypothetical protein